MTQAKYSPSSSDCHPVDDTDTHVSILPTRNRPLMYSTADQLTPALLFLLLSLSPFSNIAKIGVFDH